REARIQLVLTCCYARTNERGVPALPRELIPFLIEATHAHEFEVYETYPAIALSQVEDYAAIPALVEIIHHDEDPHARGCAAAPLRMIESNVRTALDDKDENVRREAQIALIAIAEANR